MKIKSKTKPADRPLRLKTGVDVHASFAEALQNAAGVLGAHCIHELWMRGEMAANIEAMLEKLWKSCGDSVPDWTPMRHVEWLAKVYEVAAQFKASAKGRSNIYLVLLDYSDRSHQNGPYGIYVGMSRYSAAARFDQHKAGIRAAGSVLKRGLEPLIGPVMHLQHIAHADAERIEAALADALSAEGLLVQGGH
jgi:hypothetical protein